MKKNYYGIGQYYVNNKCFTFVINDSRAVLGTGNI